MKHFSVDEAQARIVELEKVFALCAEIRVKARARVDHLQALEGEGRKDSAQIAIERSQVQFLAQCLEHALKGVDGMGAVLKGIDPGLVDFPHLLDGGEEVYLCWREGEKEIAHYHGVDEGFAGRRPLPRRPLTH